MTSSLDSLNASRQAALEGNFETALRRASEVLATYPQYLLALRLRACAELELGLESASATFRSCLAKEPLDVVSEVGWGICAETYGDVQTALARFSRAFELDPGDQSIRREIKRLGGELPETPLADGLTMLQEGSLDEAVDYLRTASARAPNDPAPMLGLAHALWHKGARQQVGNVCASLLAIQPDCLDALVYAVAAELSAGRTLRTRGLLGRIEDIDPEHLLCGPLLHETGASRAIQDGTQRPGTLASGRGF